MHAHTQSQRRKYLRHQASTLARGPRSPITNTHARLKTPNHRLMHAQSRALMRDVMPESNVTKNKFY